MFVSVNEQLQVDLAPVFLFNRISNSRLDRMGLNTQISLVMCMLAASIQPTPLLPDLPDRSLVLLKKRLNTMLSQTCAQMQKPSKERRQPPQLFKASNRPLICAIISSESKSSSIAGSAG